MHQSTPGQEHAFRRAIVAYNEGRKGNDPSANYLDAATKLASINPGIFSETDLDIYETLRTSLIAKGYPVLSHVQQ